MASLTTTVQSPSISPRPVASVIQFSDAQRRKLALQFDGEDKVPPFEEMAEDSERGSGRLTSLPSAKDAKVTQLSQQETSPRLPLRLIAIGSQEDVVNMIKTLHHLNYAEAMSWSRLQRGPNPGEVMSVLTVGSMKPTVCQPRRR